ncbi:BTAD domain-containing putative transcriptional regulator [Nonomuraea gerenzanensis]|uniref:Transcriptional regulator, SARP family n=1 Tax=Nonomuraea gerenzanensis TaxID=93944 RepID=A0A1M4DY43_9ACTN|nr:BTAD domain-containing putative transcriptional regulator [Nonomuraea gerenzanensis]UBU13751.1 AAA family ATPase [Nonomuraea gerenzanensis]SBO91420.1 transcriptional regulator, SARP family [Nonomuraea gerenzanensis]
MELRILGPLEALADGTALDLGAAKQQVILGVLLLHPNRVVSAGRLVDEVWGEAPPPSAAKVVQGYVSGLRRVLGGDAIVTRGRGYLAVVPPGALDAERFERLAREGREADPAAAAGLFRQALSLWRGEALAGLAFRSSAAGEVERLTEQRIGVTEELMEAELALGGGAALVPGLRELVAAHPYRERPRAQLMLALYRSGRQAEALAVYRDTRRLLAAELGLEPGPELRRMERLVLEQAEELAPERPSERGHPSVSGLVSRETGAPESPPGTRRLVTVLAATAASTAALDPELLHHVLDTHARTCADVVTRHGGSVQRPPGRPMAGVFGLREVREDDAPRAVRAAVELRDALQEWQADVRRDHGVTLPVRLGVESGEAYVPDGSPATGHVFDAASLLQQAAPDGGILLGDRTRALVRAMATAQPHETVAGAPAWLLSGLRREPSLRESPVPFVGRHQELHQLRQALHEVVARRDCRLVTVLGPPGIGKSRLTARLLEEDTVSVVIVRCASYGTGAELAQLVKQVPVSSAEERGPVSGEEERRPVGGGEEERVRRILTSAGQPSQADETFWAVRRLLERAAAHRPLIVVVDDAHHAPPELLDLLDYLVACSTGAPLLLLCLSRERRGSWPESVVLGPLAEPEAYKLAENAAAGALDQRAVEAVVRVAEGNPFFLEQLVAAREETGTDALPMTVQAVLAARIDHLGPAERTVLQYASVEGATFHWGAVAALVRDGARAALMSLVRKNLVMADPPQFADEDAFRFAHALIGEVAYDSLPKRTRADLHERIAGWLTGKPGAQPAAIGHHLEACVRLRGELGLSGERERTLAREAAAHLAAAAPAALLRGDVTAGALLWRRAVTLMPPDDPERAALLPRLGAALYEAGRFEQANEVLGEAIALGEPRVAALAEVERERVRLQAGTGWSLADARRVADRALRALRGDDRGLCRAWCLRASIDWTEGRAAAADESWRHAERHAALAGDDRELYEILGWRASAAAFGPMPVDPALALCERSRARVADSPAAMAVILHPVGLLLAMRGEFAQARESLREADEILGELGRLQSAVSHHEAMIELLAGRPAEAESLLRAGYERLSELGERTLLATTAAMLARALHLRGRDEEAEHACRVSARNAGEEDLPTQVMWRGVQAGILAARGAAGAVDLAREAVRLAQRTDLSPIIADALFDLAVVLYASGAHEQACTEARRSRALHERKGNAVSAEHVRAWLEARSPSE